MEGAEAQVFPVEVLREFSTRIFLHFGVSEQDAAEAADVLVCADLRGIDDQPASRCQAFTLGSFFQRAS
jgi:LDH2 family malate/lactate/ureidoglycolate dehydrogenase